MMGMGSMGDVGDIGGIVGSVVVIGIAAIVLLTFAPTISGDIDGMSVNAVDACALASGERFLWVSPVRTGTESANETWAKASSNIKLAKGAPAKCTASATALTAADFYTPKGTLITVATAGEIPGGTWDTASKSLTALGSSSGGGLVGLIFGAMGLGIPAGAIGFLAYFGAKIVRQNVGGSPMAVAIGATVAVVIIGAILPEIFEPLDDLFIALDGNRYYVYSQGIGKLGGVLGNFLGISLVGGLVSLGVMLWQGRHGSSSSMGSAV